MKNLKVPIVERVKDFLWEFDGRRIPLGVGCAYFGGGPRRGDGENGHGHNHSHGHGHEVFRAALTGDLKLMERLYNLGFRYFDTSRSYNESELAVGEFVKRVDRKTIFLATKSVFPYGREKNAFDIFRENFFASFERLQTDHIDLFQIHETDYFDCCEQQVIPFLLEQRDKGLIDYIGLGTRSLNAHELAILSGNVDSVLSYMNYSLLKRSAARVIGLAAARGVSFVNASVLHFGVIKHPDPLHPGAGEPGYGYRARSLKNTAPMQELCREMGVDIVHASLQYSLFNPGVTMTLNGIRRDSNIDSTVGAMRAVIQPEQWARIYALQEKDPYLYVQDDLLE